MSKPKLTLTAGTAPVEGGAIGTYLINLDQAAPVGGLTVNFNTLGSTATINTDYHFALGAGITAVTSNSFTIAEGASTAVLNLVAHADAILDPNETVTLNLTTGTSYQLAQDNGTRFSLESDYAVDSYPRLVTTGDFNNDGKLDLVVTNGQSGYVSVLLRNADNTGFDTKIDYQFFGSAIGVGDFNNDGKLDLAISYGGSYEGHVSVLLRNADNTGFDAKVDYITGLRPVSVGVGDFNNDGKLDLAVANYISDTVSVLLRNADNTGFDTKVDYTTGSYPTSVGTGDFNNDGKLDLAVANYSSNTVSVLLRNADNTGFDAKFDYATGSRPISVSVADFNSDGKLDLAVANFYSDTVSVFLRNADNTDFNAKVDYATGYYPRSVSAGDFNNDGKTDLAVTNEGANAVSVLWRNADSTGFDTKVDYITGVYPTSVSAGDFNNDGRLDLATANWQDSTVSVLLNNSNPTATLTIASNDAPVLSAPTTINYIDTIFDDSFATVTRVLVANDIDGDSLTYGIEGGTDNGDGTISKSNNYGTLIVNKITANYSFVPNNAGIERLTLIENSSFTVTVSDGLLSDNKTLFINVERVGSDGNDRLIGTAGNDVFNGLAGDDTISGLAGDDIINGGTGVDKMIGGKGNDTYYVDNIGDVVKERANEGVDTVYWVHSYTIGYELPGRLQYTLPDNVENLIQKSGYGFSPIGIGNALDNTLTTSQIVMTGSGTLYGLEGDDTLISYSGKSANGTLIGGVGNDSYYVSGYSSVLDKIIEYANEGEDTVYAYSGCTLADNVENLVLLGGGIGWGEGRIATGVGNALNNHLTSNIIDSQLKGLGGDDNYYVGNEGAVIVELADNGWDSVLSTTNRTLEANVEELYLLGTDNLNGTGNDQDNNLKGNVGDNILDGGAGADFMMGRAGNDTYYVDNKWDEVKENAGEGVDTVYSYLPYSENRTASYTLPSNIENLVAGSGTTGIGNELDNQLTVSYGGSTLYGMKGNDSLYGNSFRKIAPSILLGGEGDDSYYVSGYKDVTAVIIEYANEGEDTVYAYSASYTLTDNVENIVLNGVPNFNDFTGTGNTLNNHLTSDIAGSQLEGLGGDDNYYVGNEGVVIVESEHNGWDSVLSTTNRTLEANVEELYLLGTDNLNGTGNDQDNNLKGNVGDNILDGGAGADFMMGRAGNDTYYVDNKWDEVKENAGEGVDTVYSTLAAYTLTANVENLTVNLERSVTPVVTGIGNALDNYLKADGRMDISAHATLYGLAGNDILDSNIRSTSTLLGGEGNDLYYIYNIGDVVKEYTNQGIDTVSSSLSSYTLTANVENLILRNGPFGDVGISGTGNGLANHLTGGDAGNILDGKAGADTLVGGEGADILIGGLGKDRYDLSEITAATDTIRIAKGDSLASSYDMATGFQLGINALETAGVDKLDLDSVKIAADANAVNGSNLGNIKSHHISEGIISFDDVNHYANPLTITEANLANVFNYLQANITGRDTVAFVSGTDTYVFQDDGAVDTLVELVGVSATSVNNSGMTANSVWII